MGSKISVLTLALMMGASSLFAEDNGKAIDYYKVGMYGEAKKELLANLQKCAITWASSIRPRT